MNESAIYVADGGGSAKRITDGPDDGFPVWSPDGRWIAFDGQCVGGNVEVYVVAADGSSRTRITTVGVNHDPTWSPDGTKLAYTDDDFKVAVINRDGSALRRITTEGSDRTWDKTPAWSPDGHWIAFTREYTLPPPSNCFCPAQVRDDLHLIRPDGSGDRLIRTDLPVSAATWSPDGKMLAFSSGSQAGSQIWVVNVDGSNLRQLTTSGDNYRPQWAGDDDRLVYWTRDVDSAHIYVLDVTSGSATLLGEGLQPTWWSRRSA